MRHAIMLALLVALAAPCEALGGSSTTSGASNTMNPALSVNGLFLARIARESDDAQLNGVDLQEAELHFTSVVDPFWKACVILAVEPGEEEGYELGVEEASLESRSLPAGLGLKLGQFFVPFGKHSPLHTHHFPFTEAPLCITALLGEGFTEPGAQLAWGPPLPWYSDLIAYGLDGNTGIFAAADRDPAWGGRWTNLWDLGDETTLEAGGSYLRGPAAAEHWGAGGAVAVTGVDLTCKWVSSARSHGPALTLQAELLQAEVDEHPGRPWGWYLLGQCRVHHNWWIGAAHGRLDGDAGGLAGDPAELLAGETWEHKLDFTYAPSEFSALRLEAVYLDDRTGDADDLRIAVQWNFTIGSHPAHLY